MTDKIETDTIDPEKLELEDSIPSTTPFVKSEAEKRLYRKIIWRFMPLACIITFLQWIDKYTLNMSAVLGLKTDAHIDSTQFNFLGSLFYLGYLVFQIPNTYLLQRLPIGKYLGGLLMVWGVVLACMSQGRDFSTLGGLRFVLGFFEAGSYPSVLLLVATLFRRSEHATMVGALWIANGLASTFGGLIGYGSAHLVGVNGYDGWQWIFIIFGIITVFVGIVTFFFLIDHPHSKLLSLTSEEEKIVNERIRDNAAVRSKQFQWHHIWEAIKEPRLWCFCFASMFMMITNGFFTIYSSIIVASFGFSGMNAVLLQMPNGAISVLGVCAVMWASRRFNEIIYVAITALLVSALGIIILMAIPSGKVKLLGTILIHVYGSGYCMLLTAIATNASGYTKKIFYQGLQLVFYTLGNFIGPFFMNDNSAPRYLAPLGGYLACNLLACILLFVARLEMKAANQRKRAQPGFKEDDRDITLDLTDKEDPNFIYRL
ncbi:major facilitator superfamily domain-containing protein [Halteromyces radiatus]|uniref:major facilitator superfamily domain-containing protein n=1 Tax=Halteromyces radiatus TaxID=101107 RepID=UPI0022201CD6|nr:major facilitator superfamily domain-containing protein [Halteromyces radiatus]KAI8099338.1 major facilitator superfamily domain-containing protein [Halteromyces radiatus]